MYLASPFPPKMMIKKKNKNTHNACKYDDVITVGVAKAPHVTRERHICIVYAG